MEGADDRPADQAPALIGYFASEEDAARAYDRAAVEAGKPDTKRNFPGETISELPVSSGGVRKRKYTQQQREVDRLEVWKEMEQEVMADMVPILGMQEAEMYLMACRADRRWGT
jgi:hypothetical protein